MTPTEQIRRAQEVFDVEIEGLRRTRAALGDAFTRTVALMLACVEAGGKVVVTGVGKSLHVAEKTSAILASTGTCSVVLNPVQAMHGDLGMTGPKDLLLALSFSGESEELVRLVPAIRRHGLKVVALTGRTDSTLARLSDVVLEIPCGAEACPFGMAPTTSTTATMAMGDALAMVMRTGARVAAVAPATTVLDTLLAMTKAQAGSAVVVDAEGKLEGIFTDGDFRRHVSEGREVLGDAVSRHMTRHPLTIGGDAYAVDLLRVFESRQIDDLPVCAADGRLLGVVDIQDLPKMKVL